MSVNPINVFWPPEKIETLKRLWDENLSAGLIGKSMKIGKNAVVGKAHRLGLPSRPSPIHRSNSRPAPVTHRVTGPTLAPPLPPTGRLDPKRTCQYIAGERPWRFCDAPAELGYSWCPTHRRLCIIVGPGKRWGGP